MRDAASTSARFRRTEGPVIVVAMSGPATDSEQKWTIPRLLSWTTEFLSDKGVDEPRLAGEVLLAHCAGCRRIDLYTRFEEIVAGSVLNSFREMIQRAATHEPIAYIVGEKEFFSLAFFVTPDVLIPRAESEMLVEVALDYGRERSRQDPPPDLEILDIATGSGCIAVSILVQLPTARAVASDISAAALAVALRNAKRHAVDGRLSLVEADGANLPKQQVPEGGFDILVSNPPYVVADAMDTLPMTVRGFEPRMALTDDSDGLVLYRDIAARAPALVKSGGIVAAEVGAGDAPRVRATLEESSGLTWRETRRDRTVGAERVVVFEVT